ncbi:MAG: methyltransferase [Gemmata sp.]
MTPRDIFQLADRYCDSALLQHAHAAGVFDALTTPKSAGEIAASLGWVPIKTAIFLDALTALGLLVKDGVAFKNAPATSECLVRGRPGYIGDLIEHERLQWSLWGRLGDVLASEGPVSGQQDLNLPADEYANAVFHRAMMQLAGELLGVVTSLPEWEGVRHVLDLAGGHGLYLGELARRHPRITGEVWDVPSARPHAETLLASLGVGDRVRFVERDIAAPASYAGVRADAVMLNHCLHHFDPATVGAILRSVAGTLPTGGIVVALDVHLDRTRTSPAENALFSAYMMVNTVRGQVHPTDEVAALLRESGFAVENRLLDSLEGDYLMVGRKV